MSSEGQATAASAPPAPGPRPIDPALHPIETGCYRIATPAIQAFSDLVNRCLRYHITGALTYGPSRIGKTRAIEYLRLLLAQTHPRITTYHAQAEHKPRHAEGPFLANLLEAVGYPDPASGNNSTKRMRLINKIKEACSRNGSGTAVLFCDEAQRYDEHEYEWLRDVHDHLDRLQIRLFTFLVGQQELLAVKTAMQHARKTQIVSRLMVEELAFFGIRNVRDVATCLNGYDETRFPRASEWSFTRFYLPRAVQGGYRLVHDSELLWSAFEHLHHKHGLPGALEIPMESFTRAVEIVLKDSELRDSAGCQPDAALWNVAVRNCGYIQSRQAVSAELMTSPA
ncbi:ATP-binding protein [Variovorax sp. J22R133]|uniref:ATP-binding protein n=1 Tax=Variovorax brevis TaxID=3053503 RepID=UPI002577473F|nr:ATP-binding protein [Variovorax sp. J22R133]MDM0118109.1 ATP-binding protein [Variovorax sp. J22R133]